MADRSDTRAGRTGGGATERGFTLVEVLAVMAILGLLAAVGVLAFGGLRGKATVTVNHTELLEVRRAASAYEAVVGSMPTGLADLTGATPPYIDRSPRCAYGNFVGEPENIAQVSCP